MSKRFTDSEKWTGPWFRLLSPPAKLLWFYVLDACNAAGVISLQLDLAGFLIGLEITDAHLAELEQQLEPIDGGKLWIGDFVPYQIGTPTWSSPAHRPVIKLLKNHRKDGDTLYNTLMARLSLDLRRGSDTLQEKEKEKETKNSRAGARDAAPEELTSGVGGGLPRASASSHSDAVAVETMATAAAAIARHVIEGNGGQYSDSYAHLWYEHIRDEARTYAIERQVTAAAKYRGHAGQRFMPRIKTPTEWRDKWLKIENWRDPNASQAAPVRQKSAKERDREAAAAAAAEQRRAIMKQNLTSLAAALNGNGAAFAAWLETNDHLIHADAYRRSGLGAMHIDLVETFLSRQNKTTDNHTRTSNHVQKPD